MHHAAAAANADRAKTQRLRRRPSISETTRARTAA
jgi:hypothetical protein